MNSISVLIVDDHAIVRDSLAAVLKFEPDITICGMARDGRHAVALARELRPNVILMDIAMPRLNGLEATRQIMSQNRRARVIMLSAHLEPAYAPRAISAGAVGYLFKHASGGALARAIREVASGKMQFAPAITKMLSSTADKIVGFCRAAVEPAGLSLREAEVMQLVAEGATTKEIAWELGVTRKTVEKHRQRVMWKLGAHNIAALTRSAIATGMIDPGFVAMKGINVVRPGATTPTGYCQPSYGRSRTTLATGLREKPTVS